MPRIWYQLGFRQATPLTLQPVLALVRESRSEGQPVVFIFTFLAAILASEATPKQLRQWDNAECLHNTKPLQF